MLRLAKRYAGPALAIVFVAGAALGGAGSEWYANHQFSALWAGVGPRWSNDTSLPLVRQLLACRIPEALPFNSYAPLDAAVTAFVNKEVAAKHAQGISLYYRSLTNGRWIGVDETKTYNPASMMKIAIAIAYYKLAESDQEILTRPIVYTKELDAHIADIPLQEPTTLTVGRSYTVEELIRRMLVDSDNGAKNALLSGLDDAAFANLYVNLGINNPAEYGNAYTISAQQYSLFFRVLYNATYLSPAYSERLLEILAKAVFKDGIIAGVPSSTTVAQKFGEYIATNEAGNATGIAELHDCGIVYKEKNPYVLCIMTRGTDVSTLTGVIAQLSRIVYDNE